MSTWDDAAEWYLAMVNDPASGFNHLAIDLVVDMLGPVAGLTVLDIGSGDGALARHLARGGALVTATEPTAALHAAATTAAAAEPLGIRHLTNRAEQLVDIDDATTDCAVALLVLHHVADLDHAIHELHRVLRPGGRAVVVIPHPATDHPGAAWHPTPTGPRRLMGDYDTETYWQTDETNTIRAIGWHHRTTATWITTFARHGFIVDELREPTGTDPRRPDRGGPWADVPRFLALRLHKPAERADPR